MVEAGYTHSFCTPHIWPDLPHNSVSMIPGMVRRLQAKAELDQAGVALAAISGRRDQSARLHRRTLRAEACHIRDGEAIPVDGLLGLPDAGVLRAVGGVLSVAWGDGDIGSPGAMRFRCRPILRSLTGLPRWAYCCSGGTCSVFPTRRMRPTRRTAERVLGRRALTSCWEATCTEHTRCKRG